MSLIGLVSVGATKLKTLLQKKKESTVSTKLTVIVTMSMHEFFLFVSL